MTLREKVDDLNNSILTGKLLDAFEKYYAEDVVMQDNNGDPRKGKEACRQYEHQFVDALEQFNDGKVKNVIVGEDVSVVDWYMDMTFKNGHREKRDQVAVQEWKDGKIVRETFYYAT